MMILASVLGGCTPSVTFRRTDPSFRPSHAATVPPVYTTAGSVPPVQLRSVGIVTVAARSGASSRDAAIEAAATTGKSVGCWALIEHAVFLGLEGRSTGTIPDVNQSDVDGAHATGATPGSRRSYSGPHASFQFDCVRDAKP